MSIAPAPLQEVRLVLGNPSKTLSTIQDTHLNPAQQSPYFIHPLLLLTSLPQLHTLVNNIGTRFALLPEASPSLGTPDLQYQKNSSLLKHRQDLGTSVPETVLETRLVPGTTEDRPNLKIQAIPPPLGSCLSLQLQKRTLTLPEARPNLVIYSLSLKTQKEYPTNPTII